MSLLNFDSQGHKPNHKSLKLVLGVGVIVGVIALGSTLAADISLNLGAPVEFGQGIAQTTACDDDITITPFSTFVNEEEAGSHKFTSLQVSGIDSSSGKCDGKSFVIKAYGDSGILDILNYEEIENPYDDEPLVIQDEDYDTIEIANDGGVFTWVSGGTDGDDVIQVDPDILTNTSFTLNFASTSSTNTITRTPLVSAEDVVRITIESKDWINNFVQISPAISTEAQTFVFNPALNLKPTLHPYTGVCDIDENPGWLVIVAPDFGSYISIYTFGEVNRDTTLKIYDSDGINVAEDDDDDGNNSAETSQYASDQATVNFSALTFNATGGKTYYIGLADCDPGTPANEDVNIGYYYEPLP